LNPRRTILPAFIIAFFLAAHPARADEVSLLLGRMEALNTFESSYSWQVDYRYNPARYLAWSASYLNEGHVPGHKRDGVATQLWGRVPLFKGRIDLSFGVGPYRFFDTATRPDGTFNDVQGWAGIYGASAAWHTKSPLLVRLTANRIKGAGGVDTNTYVLGVGYRLWKEREPGELPEETEGEIPLKAGDEVTLFAGRTVVNSPQDQKGIASGIELRKGIVDHLDWTLTWLNEGDPQVVRRNGLCSQIWLVDAYLDNRFTVGAGVGGYYFIDRKRPPRPGKEGTRDLAYLLSLTAGYRFTNHWFTRFNWNRVLADYNRDTDVFTLGLGFRWKG
jgi:hypothetical protein